MLLGVLALKGCDYVDIALCGLLAWDVFIALDWIGLDWMGLDGVVERRVE